MSKEKLTAEEWEAIAKHNKCLFESLTDICAKSNDEIDQLRFDLRASDSENERLTKEVETLTNDRDVYKRLHLSAIGRVEEVERENDELRNQLLNKGE